MVLGSAQTGPNQTDQNYDKLVRVILDCQILITTATIDGDSISIKDRLKFQQFQYSSTLQPMRKQTAAVQTARETYIVTYEKSGEKKTERFPVEITGKSLYSLCIKSLV